MKRTNDLINYHENIMSLNNKFKIFETLDEIPKVIHISWKSKNILNSKNPMIINGILNMKNINPEYDLQINDDEDVEQYIISHISNKDYENIKKKHIVEKVDLWRLLKMYYEGGIYVDIDRYCNIPFKNIIGLPTISCVTVNTVLVPLINPVGIIAPVLDILFLSPHNNTH
jgi:mannosyltransferase OCH1-like enzyme